MTNMRKRKQSESVPSDFTDIIRLAARDGIALALGVWVGNDVASGVRTETGIGGDTVLSDIRRVVRATVRQQIREWEDVVTLPEQTDGNNATRPATNE